MKCYQSISKPTRVTNETATLIDNVFLSQEYFGKMKSYVILDDISDHLPCLCVLTDIYPTKKKEHSYIKRRLNDKTISYIINDIEKTNWKETVGPKVSCEEMFNNLHDRLTTTLNKHAPEKIVKTKEKLISEPWLTKGLKKCQKKQKLLIQKNTTRGKPNGYHGECCQV